MTAYRIAPVHTRAEWPGEVVEIPSRVELRTENERLKVLLAETQAARDAATALWREEVERRIAVQALLGRLRRALASLASMSPQMAGLVASAKRKVGRLDE